MPARAPLRVTRRLQVELPNTPVLPRMRVKEAEAEAEMMVFTTAMLALAPLPWPLMFSCEPPLKARKPKQRMKPPRAASCHRQCVESY